MSESQGGSPIQIAVVVLMLVGGGWYFLRHYEIDGLDGVSVNPKGNLEDEESFVSFREAPAMIDVNRGFASTTLTTNSADDSFTLARGTGNAITSESRPARSRSYRNVKVASWALDGFGPTKLANRDARKYVTQVVRQFDIVAIQQIASIERDLIPRLVDVINAGENRYDYVMGESTGPTGRQEQLAFIFDISRVLVDRRQSYTVEDPEQQMTYDPLVASFRAAQPSAAEAWTFSLVNVRIDLARAPLEVAILPNMLESIRGNGRGEDDIVLLGLFQADDAYLIPTMGGRPARAAVQNRSTDVFGRYQTSNIIVDSELTSEYLGRGGAFDYPRAFDLNPIEAEAVTSHLPVFADFTAHEGGAL